MSCLLFQVSELGGTPLSGYPTCNYGTQQLTAVSVTVLLMIHNLTFDCYDMPRVTNIQFIFYLVLC